MRMRRNVVGRSSRGQHSKKFEKCCASHGPFALSSFVVRLVEFKNCSLNSDPLSAPDRTFFLLTFDDTGPHKNTPVGEFCMHHAIAMAS